MNSTNELEKREKELNDILKESDNRLKKLPTGKLKVINKNGRSYYYLRKDGKDSVGKYISRNNIDKAKKIAQRDYELMVRKAVIKEMDAISLYSKAMPEQTYEDVYDKLIYGRKILVTPHFIPEEPYEKLYFEEDTAEHFTDRGERVRSKSEVIIANALNQVGIPYKYECPAYLGKKKIYPDFTIMKMPGRKEIYWEHLGMLDDPSYLSKNLDKLESYEENGIFLGDNLILTRETSDSPLNTKQVWRTIEHYLL